MNFARSLIRSFSLETCAAHITHEGNLAALLIDAHGSPGKLPSRPEVTQFAGVLFLLARSSSIFLSSISSSRSNLSNTPRRSRSVAILIIAPIVLNFSLYDKMLHDPLQEHNFLRNEAHSSRWVAAEFKISSYLPAN